jgi:CBS domain-containing protein
MFDSIQDQFFMAGSSMRVGEICNRHAAIVGKSDSIYRVAVIMRNLHVHDVVVVESRDGNNIPVGVVSDHDIVVNMITQRLDLDAVSVGDVMHTSLLLANEQDSAMTTLKRMRHKKLRYIPVVTTNGALVGTLSIDDILDKLSEQLDDISYIVGHEQSNVRDDIVESQPHA